MHVRWRGMVACAALAVASCSLRDVSDLTRDTDARADVDGGAPPGTTADGGCALGPYACAVLEADPLLYLRFDEGSVSERVKDTSGHMPVGPGYPPGTTVQVRGALEAHDPNLAARLAITDEGIVMPSGLDFAGRAPFSVELWIKPEGGDPDKLSLVLDHETWAAARGGWGLVFHEDSTSVSFELWDAGASFFVGLSPDGAVSLDVWHHVVFAFDGSRATFWVDGSATSGSVEPGNLPAVPGGWRIGKQNCDQCNSNSYRGGIDELAIYGRSLDDAAVQRHYAAARVSR